MSKLSNSTDQNNVSTFEAQIQSATSGLVTAITALSPLFLMLTILGIAGANAYVEYLFQQAIFKDMALMPAILVAGLRFSSGMGGITLMKNAKFIAGLFFIFISLLLTIYTGLHIQTIATTIAPGAEMQANVTIKLILWGGFIGEIMIAVYQRSLGNSAKPLPGVKWWKTEKATNGQAVEN